MKLLLAAMILISVHAFAFLDCHSIDPDRKGFRLTIVETTSQPSTLTVRYNEEIIYRIGVVNVTEPNSSLSYHSLSFANRNGAPAALFVSIYRKDGQLLGNFSEGSYMPVVPHLQLRCKQSRAEKI